jgi:hypothetical protein
LLSVSSLSSDLSTSWLTIRQKAGDRLIDVAAGLAPAFCPTYTTPASSAIMKNIRMENRHDPRKLL